MEEVRLECLRLALAHVNTFGGNVMDEAWKYYEFVTGKTEKPKKS